LRRAASLPPTWNEGVGAKERPRTAGTIPEFADFFWRKTETWCIVLGDDEFDRREPCDYSDERRVG
jgi:hypothetical protein